jgi:anti-sigma B factor antagonist
MVQPADSPGRRGISVGSVVTEAGVVVRVAGVVDMLTADTLAQHLSVAMEPAPAALIVDLSEVDFLSSAGLEVLVNTHNDAGDTTAVVVVSDKPVTGRPIRLTGLDQVLTLCCTVQDAWAVLGGG